MFPACGNSGAANKLSFENAIDGLIVDQVDGYGVSKTAAGEYTIAIYAEDGQLLLMVTYLAGTGDDDDGSNTNDGKKTVAGSYSPTRSMIKNRTEPSRPSSTP